MTWTVRSVLAFGVGLFALTLFGEGLYHLIGSPGCRSTPAEPVRCSEESGWWALVAGGGAVVAILAIRAARDGTIRRAMLGAALLGGGLAPLWAAVDDRTDAAGWIAGGAVALLAGVAVLAGLAAAGLRQVREPELLARPPERLAAPEAATEAAPDAPAVRVAGDQDPFGREPGEGADPFGRR